VILESRKSQAAIGPSQVREALAASALAGPWQVWRARHGWSRRTFVAANGERRVFVKFEVAVDVLRRLGELAVTPPLLYAGDYRGHAYAVQPYLGGRHPRRAWFARRPSELGRLVRAYQHDARLRALVAPTPIPTYEAHIAAIIVGLEGRSRSSLDHQPPATGFGPAADQLRDRCTKLEAADLVPTHGDPNWKNFVLNEAVFLVDWDEIALADPLRDIGQLLWWYVPPTRWEVFLPEFGLVDNDAARDRLYWWVAAESLDVAMTLHEAGDPAGANEFLRDFAAAIDQRANPHARS
jgi:hypothetical protein